MSSVPLKEGPDKRLLSRPWFLFLAPLLLVRSLNTIHYYFSEHSAAGPMNMIPVSLAHHTSVLVILTVIFLWMIKAAGSRWALRLTVFLSSILMVLGSVDFLVQHHLGSRFTLSLLQTYGISSLLHREVYLPLLMDGLFTTINLGILLLGCVLLHLLCRRTAISVSAISKHESLIMTGIAALLIIPVLFDRNLQRKITQPPELVLLKELIPTHTLANDPEAPSLKLAFLALTQGTDPKEPKSNYLEVQSRPDIFILAIESLRASNLEFISGNPNSAHTPNLSALSNRGIVFTHFIANGFPSTEGFLSIHCSLWPHPHKRILVQLTDLNPDCLPSRLKKHGYHTKIFWGVNPDFDNQLNWAKRWYDDLVYQVPGNTLKHNLNMSDAGLFQLVMKKIQRHDESSSGTPVFAYVANAGTHVPFTLRGLYFNNREQEEEARRLNIDQTPDSNERYNLTLELLDLQIGKFWNFLQERGRPFVLLILGDHSIPTKAPMEPAEKHKPSNDYLWTGALLIGSEKGRGQPRKVNFPASQVDVMPTLLSLAGAPAPYPGLGKDLLAKIQDENRRAVAFRESYLRLDQNGNTLMVNMEDPSQFEIQFFPGDNNFAGDVPPLNEKMQETARNLQLAARYWAGLLNQRLDDQEK